MATLNNLSVVLTGNSTQLSSVLTRSAAEIRAFQQTAQSAGSGGSKALAAVGGAATVAALGFVYAATQAAEFEKEMRNVSTIDATVRTNFAQTSATVLELSKHLPQTAKELASGLYDISSSGFQGTQSLNILKASATAASAGLSTTANSAKAITATLNAYGLSAGQAGRVSDTLFQTVNFGVVSFDELTGVIGDTVGTAAAAGVNIEQLGSAVATLTLSGLSASEAGVSLNRVLTSLIKPNDALKAAQKQLGVSFTDDLKNPSIGLKGVLDELLNSVGGNKTAFANLFTDIRASRGVLALEANDGKNYTRVLQEMGVASDNTGATQRALTEQAKGTSFQLQILKNDVNAAAITLGEKLLPVIDRLAGSAEKAGGVIGKDLVAAAHELQPVWNDLVDIGRNLGGIFHDLYDAGAPVVKIFAGAVFEGAAKGLQGLGTATKATTGYLADHRTVVTALVLAYAALHLEAITTAFTRLGVEAALLATNGLVGLIHGVDLAAAGMVHLGGGVTLSEQALLSQRAAAAEAAAVLAQLAAAAAEAAAAESGFTVAADGALVATGRLDAALVEAAATSQAYAAAQTEAAQAARLAAASTTGVASGLALGAAKGAIWLAFLYVAGVALNSYTDEAKAAAALQQQILKQGGNLAGSFDTSSPAGATQAVAEQAKTLQAQVAGAFGTGTDKAHQFVQAILDGRSKTADWANDFKKLKPDIAVNAQALSDLVAQQKKVTTEASNVAKLASEYGITTDKVKALASAHKIDLTKSFADVTKVEDGHKKTTDGLITTYDKLLDTWSKTEIAADPLKKAQTDLSNANKKWSVDLDATNKNWKDQIDLMQEYKAQSDVTAASIQANVTKNLALLQNETANIATLQAKGASGQLIQQLVNEGPEYVAAGASAGKDTIKGWNSALAGAGAQKKLQEALVTGSLNPADLKAKTDAAAKVAFLTFAQGAEDATKQALGILAAFPPNATDKVTAGLQAQHAKVLAAFLGTLDAPTRQAVEQALTAAHVGSQNIASQIVSALIQAKPSAVFQAQDLYTKVQGQLDKLHGKDLQVILQDLASGNIGALITDLGNLGSAILKLPAGVAIGVPQVGAGTFLAPTRARGGPIYGAGSQRGDKIPVWASNEEWFIQAPSARKYGRTAMQSVNDGTAEIIPHFANGGQVASNTVASNQRYSSTMSDAGLAGHIGQYDQVILSAIKRLQAQAQQLAAATASAALGGASPGGSDAAKAYAIASLSKYGWGMDQWPPLDTLWAHESGWNPYAQNSIGAYGIPQAYGHGNVFALGDYHAQVDWGLNYIKQAYGSPAAAWAQWYKPDGSGSYAEGGPVGAYLTALKNQADVQSYLTALSQAKKVQPLGVFLQGATKLGLGAHDLAVRGLQDAYGMPNRNSTWDQSTTDFLAVNSAKVGAKSAAIRYLQLALKRPVTGILSSGDLPKLYSTVNSVAFPDGSTYGTLLHTDANQTAFQGYLQTISRRGFAPLAAALQQQGPDTALAGARQLANAPLATLQKANAAAIRTSASSKYGDALNLASDLAQYGGKVGLLGLASRSGSSVSDVLGLVTSFPQVFSSMGSTAKLLINDLDRISRGLQPVAAYAQGAYEIKKDHVAVVHQGETVLPREYAEPWRRQQATAGGSGGGVSVTFAQGAIPVTVGDVASMGQVRSEVKKAIGDTIGQVVTKALAQTGSRA